MGKRELTIRFNEAARAMREAFEQHPAVPELAGYWVDFSPGERNIEGYDCFVLWAIRKEPSTVLTGSDAPADVIRTQVGLPSHEVERAGLQRAAAHYIKIGFMSLTRAIRLYDHFPAEGVEADGA